MTVGMAHRALDDNAHCGDLCAAWENGATVTMCIADGLGHGRAAAEASAAAVAYVADRLDQPLVELFAGCDREIASTRGVAMAIAIADLADDQLTYAGIGNTRGRTLGKNTKTLNSNYGIVGGGFKKLAPETVPFCLGDSVVLWTDGMPEDIELRRYATNLQERPRFLAETILEDCRLGTDDAGVLVFRRE